MSVPGHNFIQVFSFDGEELEDIELCDDGLIGDFYIQNIAIHNNIIYLTTYDSNEIFVFDYCGNYLFKIDCNFYQKIITVTNSNLYVSSNSFDSNFVIIYELLYDDKFTEKSQK